LAGTDKKWPGLNWYWFNLWSRSIFIHYP